MYPRQNDVNPRQKKKKEAEQRDSFNLEELEAAVPALHESQTSTTLDDEIEILKVIDRRNESTENPGRLDENNKKNKPNAQGNSSDAEVDLTYAIKFRGRVLQEQISQGNVDENFNNHEEDENEAIIEKVPEEPQTPDTDAIDLQICGIPMNEISSSNDMVRVSYNRNSRKHKKLQNAKKEETRKNFAHKLDPKDKE